MTFDRMDICSAYFMYASLYHGGQWSDDYRIFGRLVKIRFNPGPMLTVEKLSENGRAIFDNLVARKGHPPYTAD